MASQLRIYDITQGDMEEFARQIRELVVPIRLDHGFTIDGPWIVKEANQYVLIVHYEGDLPFEEAADAYYADPRRAELEFNPRDYIVKADIRMMDAL